MNYSKPDLTVHPPRSPRIRLGGVAVLPRMLDKCRASLVQKNGEYHFNCPLDQRCLTFLGIDVEALQSEVAKGGSDNAIWEWITENTTTSPSAWEIEQWSQWQSSRVPTDPGSREYFHGVHESAAKAREDIGTWFDLLDMDDYASFGGQP